jgi:hypothetical protein
VWLHGLRRATTVVNEKSVSTATRSLSMVVQDESSWVQSGTLHRLSTREVSAQRGHGVVVAFARLHLHTPGGACAPRIIVDSVLA